MIFTEIENYLAVKHIALDKNVGNEIEKLRQKAILDRNEKNANYCWCLKNRYSIPKDLFLQ